jgi:hypothetical protein
MSLFVYSVNIVKKKLFILETGQNDIARISIGGV